LAAVASDWLGVSGRAILSRLLNGEEDAEKLAQLCRGRLREKIAEMQLALEGRVTQHHRWLLTLLKNQLEFSGKTDRRPGYQNSGLHMPVPESDGSVYHRSRNRSRGRREYYCRDRRKHGAICFCPAPGELGWPCPGNNESASKRLSGKARNGCVWVRRSLCQAAWAVSHSKNTCLSAQFRRLAARKGKKRAIVAVAHTILIILFCMLKNQQPYRDLGADYFDRRNVEQLKRSLIRRLERFGLQVTVQNHVFLAIQTA
jgi:transposase